MNFSRYPNLMATPFFTNKVHDGKEFIFELTVGDIAKIEKIKHIGVLKDLVNSLMTEWQKYWVLSKEKDKQHHEAIEKVIENFIQSDKTEKEEMYLAYKKELIESKKRIDSDLENAKTSKKQK